MAGNRPRIKKIRCFSFRRRRNFFNYVDDPSEANVDNLAEPVLDQTVISSLTSKQDDIRSDSTEDRDDIRDDKIKYEGYNSNVTNYNNLKDKSFKKKPSSRGKIKTPRSEVQETSNLTKPRDDHVSSEPNYLGYGMIDLPNDFRKLTTNPPIDNSLNKEALNYHSFKRDDSVVYREIVGGGSKFLIGGKLSDGKPSIESRVWDMLERRGWGMLHGNWNVMAPKVFNKVVEFLTGIEISLCRQVSKGWYKNVTDVMVMRSEVIVDAFKKAYIDKLEYDRSYILFQPVLTAIKSLRIDVIIRAKVEPYCTLYKNSFGYTYSYQSTNTFDSKDTTPKGNESYRSKESSREGHGLFNRKSTKNLPKTPSNVNNKVSKKSTFISKFIFEVLKKNSPRTITFTRDLSSMHRDDMNLAASASVYQICEGDYIEVPITLINAIGSTDVNSVKFLPLVRDVLSNAPSQLDLLHREWYTVEPNSKYLEQLFPQNIHSYSIIHPHKLLPQLVHQVTQVAGIDVITSKSSYVASHIGHVLESRNIIGHTVEVIPKTDCIICMIHRLGLQHDRICHVQLRPGDVLQLYLTKG